MDGGKATRLKHKGADYSFDWKTYEKIKKPPNFQIIW